MIANMKFIAFTVSANQCVLVGYGEGNVFLFFLHVFFLFLLFPQFF